MNGANISINSLVIASSLVFISLIFSYFQKLKLEKEIIISVVRAILQLFAVGYILQYIFGLESPIFTTLFLLFMTVNASYNASKRGKEIKNGFIISLVSIISGAGITLFVLLLSKAIKYTPEQIIPVSGMIISNSIDRKSVV